MLSLSNCPLIVYISRTEIYGGGSKVSTTKYSSMVIQRIYEDTGQQGRCAYVLAAQEGVPLYAKFGFKIVGHIETTQGVITPIFGPSQRPF
jgi:hypothetical protein